MIEIYRPCPVCFSENIKNIRKINFNMDGLMPDYYILAKCNNCGFIYANTPATRQDYDRYYIDNNRYNNLPTQEETGLSIYKKVSFFIKKHISKDHKVLDIGCGRGDMLKLMNLDGFKYLTGLDPSPLSNDKLLKAGLSGITGNIYDEPSVELHGKFDALILSGVLEHFYDLRTTIKNLKLYLRLNGKVLCFVPNVLDYDLYSSPLPHYINVEHINHFSPNSIVSLFANNGFSLLECVNTQILFSNFPDPLLLVAFEYISVKDFAERKIHAMLSDTDSHAEKLSSLIDELVVNKNKIAVFGAGNFSRSLMLTTNLAKVNIVCFIDNDTSLYNKHFCGYKVNHPGYIYEFDGDILILSMHSYEEIKKQIMNMGFVNRIIDY